MNAKGVFWRLALVSGALVVAGIAAAIALIRSAQLPTEAKQDRPVAAVVQAVFADNRLWLLTENGGLVSLRPDAQRAEAEALSGQAIAICRSGAVPLALSEDAAHQHWTLHARTGGKWSARRSLSTDGDALIGFTCDDRGALIVTDRRLLAVEGDAVREIRLGSQLEPAIVRTTLYADARSAWVGFNNGEWGGGLVRIDRASGKVETIEHNATEALCGGPLNGGCDPVNAIVPSPRDPACIVAAVGLVHMMQHGRIVEVCGTSVRRLYFKADDPQPPYQEKGADEPASTIAFFGGARAGAETWVVGTDGLYRFPPTGAPAFQPLPRFENRGGYRVSFDVPGVALVLTGVNGKASMSGAVPLMAPR
jgi:hypothetical protein